MNAMFGIFGLLLLILPVALAYWLVEWRLVTAFISTAVLFPIVAMIIVQIFLALFQDKKFDWIEIKDTGGIFAIGSIYVYMILVLPAFLYLRALPIAVYWSFPVMVTLIVFGVFFLLKNSRPADVVTVTAITICSCLHSWMILGVYYLLKKI